MEKGEKSKGVRIGLYALSVIMTVLIFVFGLTGLNIKASEKTFDENNYNKYVLINPGIYFGAGDTLMLDNITVKNISKYDLKNVVIYGVCNRETAQYSIGNLARGQSTTCSLRIRHNTPIGDAVSSPRLWARGEIIV